MLHPGVSRPAPNGGVHDARHEQQRYDRVIDRARPIAVILAL